MQARVILLHTMAPPKPAEGAACNGCGVCCAAEPCPLGALLSRKRHGRCVVLTWDEGQHHYRCGALTAWSPRLPAWLAAWARRMALRWISAGSGCDCSLQASAH